jgi:hypothetical protein
MSSSVTIQCQGFTNPLTDKRQKAQDHTPTREVPTSSRHQVKRCVGCQKAYEWYRYQSNLKNLGKPYQEEWDGPLIGGEDV